VWCIRKPGRDLRDKVEMLLAWRRVQRDVREGVLGADYDKADHQEIQARVAEAQQEARDEVWGSYRFVALADSAEPGGLKVIDLGAGHSSSTETLCGRVIGALKAEALLNESVGAGYIDRNRPPALRESGAWPLASLRQSFLNGALTRLLDPDTVLKTKVVEFVGRGDFGLASGPRIDGGYERLWYQEMVPPDEVDFESGVVLLKKARAEELRKRPAPTPGTPTAPEPEPVKPAGTEPGGGGTGSDIQSPTIIPSTEPGEPSATTIRLTGTVPPEVWNRLGTRILPKLRSGKDLKIGIEFSVTVEVINANDLQSELRQILADLGLKDAIDVEQA
jgi:hypothetical protein